MADYEEMWEEITRNIKSRIGEMSFKRWLGSIRMTCEGEKIVFYAPTDFSKDYITKNYLKTLQGEFQKLSGKNLDVSIKTDPEGGAPPPPARTESPGKAESPKNSKNAGAPPTQFVQTASSAPSAQPPSAARETGPAEAAKTQKTGPFRKEFTFENYVVDDSNRFAASAAEAIAKNPGIDSYNPLFIYGGVGLGKTHLIQAVGNYVYNNSEYQKVIYVTAEDFMNDFTESIRNREMPAFRSKYRNPDILLIDDIHQLADRETASTQEELFNTFNALKDKQKQMVFTCDRPATQLKKVTERLITRFTAGMSMNIQMPKYETRLAILRKKLESQKVSIQDDVLDLIARNISTNVRDLVGALNTLIGYSQLVNKNITLAVAQEQLKNIFTAPKQSNISVDIILQTVANHFSISISDIKSKKKTQNIVYPRQLAMYITRHITELSTTEIAQSFGGKDHSTVLHSIEVIEKKKQSDPSKEILIQDLIRTIKEQSVK